MTIKELINDSGILEEYVLGQHSDQEAQGVECLSTTYPEIKQEIEVLQRSLTGFGQSFEKAPPKHLKAKIFDQMTFAEDKEVEEVSSEIEEVLEVKTVPLWSKISIAASVLLAASSIWLFTQKKELESQTAALSTQMEELTTKSNTSDQFLAQFQNPDNKVLRLNGVEAKPDGAVTVFWNQKDNSVALNVNNLPKAPTGMQYQLWIIDGSGPVDMGMIDNNFEGKLLSMKKVNGQPAAFAITLEKEGGVPSPTLEQLYVIANV